LTDQEIDAQPEAANTGPSASRSGRWAAWLPDPRAVLLLIILASVLARVLLLPKPDGALIFDETYYVNAARTILHLVVPEGSPYAGAPAGLDPNTEHPPLGKVLIATSMRVFGDNAFGWRVPSVIAGILAILLLYGIVRAAGGDQWMATIAAGLLAFDNLALVHSRIGSLDMLLVMFLLFGAWSALRGWPILAGIGFALAALIKINGVFGVGAALLVELGLIAWARRDGPGGWRPHARAMVLLVVTFVPVWFAGLWLLDDAFTGFASPVAHLQHILDYGLSLTRVTAINQESYPWQWLINEVPMTYLRTDEQTIVNGEVVGSFATIFFRGAMNPFVIGAAPFGVAYALYRVIDARDRVGLWVVAWVAAMYLPFVLLALVQHRVSYIFYFLPTLPAVAVGAALFLRRAGLPPLVVGTYLAAVLLGFVLYYPFRTFG
jgi:predicted membrane-bound dolichyl-phosphate-mannose-protein mannosyltransferase